MLDVCNSEIKECEMPSRIGAAATESYFIIWCLVGGVMLRMHPIS